MVPYRSRSTVAVLALALALPAACFPNKKLTVGATALMLEDVARASSRQSDLRLIREGTPAFLMLLDGMVEAWPSNDRLLLAAAQSHASFASAFTDESQKDYTRILYGKALGYALRALELRGVAQPRTAPFETFEARIAKLDKDDAPYLFWAAATWGNWISLNMDSIEAVSELPRVEWMMKRMLEIDEAFYYGGPHLFMGIWFASRPKIAGGNLDIARYHFERAIELGRGKFLMTQVYYAQYYAKKRFDKDLFTATLEAVLRTPVDVEPDLTLMNTVAQQKATVMLKEADDYF
jgi:hypothetical protein